VIDRSFPLAAIEEAESYVRENHNFGKVIIDVRSTS
jgi:NADPH:quinone reductase-like Zn-dependent oxidoreductase